MSFASGFNKVRNKAYTILEKESKRKGPIDEGAVFNVESLPSIPSFIKMLELGFLTEDSQEGLMNQSKKNEENDESDGQRAYVVGWMEDKIAVRFNAIINLTDKVSLSWCPTLQESIEIQRGKGPCGHPRVPVTYKKIPGKDTVNWFTNLNPASGHETDFFQQIYFKGLNAAETKAVRKRLVAINCFDPTVGRLARSKDGLFPAVIRALRQANKV